MTRLLLSYVFLIAGWLAAQDNAPVPSQDKEYTGVQNFQFALIQVPVWVTDKQGLRVDGLKKKDFNLSVDGNPVKVEKFLRSYAEPIELVFLMDVSGSMALGGKYEASVAGLRYVIENAMRQDRWRCIVFGLETLGEIADSTRPDDLNQLDKIEPYGKTALYDTLSKANTFFEKGSLGNRALVLFTDGNDTSSQMSEDEMLQVLSVLDVPVFVLGIADGFLPSEPNTEEPMNIAGLRAIADISGGRTLVARNAEEFPRFVAEVRKHLRAHYMLSFTVERGKGERRHHIDVSMRKKAHEVRHRKGYVGFSPDFSR